ncbi:MAG: sigma-70 family RNA polymerase sigma factor [Christensenellales bacterium]|nr:sigma-70 family RNA polymerase sigma factor [Christensenellales bacterium]
MRTTRQASIDTELLLKQYADTGAPELRDAVVHANLYIAQIIARRFSGRGVDYDDLFQVASLALFKAIDRYDASKGIKFVSYITPTMVGEVKNYFRDRSRLIRLPRRGAQLARAIREAREALEQQLGRAPRVDELADYLHTTEDEVLGGLEIAGHSAVSSLDAQITEDDEEASFSRFLGINESGYADFEQNDMLQRAMHALDARQREVIRLRYFVGLSQRDAAKRLKISQMTVSRAERQALEILRQQLATP